MNYKIITSLFLLCHPFLNSQSYVWPTDASQLMTSSFCEYRPGHFHAGIDIKTWGEEGYQVFAIGPGYIKRILVSPYGYGKAVYLKLYNGFTVVYGHLSRFNEAMETRIKQQQQLKGQYALDLYFGPEEFPVQASELLAYTGQTGIGVPHLHFEVRDTEDRPFNPLDLGYWINDTQPPVIQSIAVSPLEYGSHVDGDFIPQIFEHNAQDDASIILISVWGRIGLSVSVFDQANGASNRFSPYTLRLFIDDSLTFQKTYHRFCYSETHLIDLDRDFRLNKWGQGEYQNLFIHPSNTLPFNIPSFPEAAILKCWYPPYRANTVSIPELGVRTLSTGLHRVCIEAEDYWGNVSRSYAQLNVIPLAELMKSDNANTAIQQNLSPANSLEKTWVNNSVRFVFRSREILSNPPRLLVWLNGMIQASLPLMPNHAGEFVGVIPLTSEFHGKMVCQVKVQDRQLPVWQDTTQVYYIDQNGGILSSSDRRFKCTIPSDAMYEPAWFHIHVEQDSLNPHPSYSIIPNDIFIKRSFKMQIAIPRNPLALQGAGFYSSHVKNQYLAGSLDIQRGVLSAQTRSLSHLTVLQDTVPPVLYSIFPDSGRVLSNDSFQVNISFADSLSGISGEDNYQIWIDGHRQIVAYDPEDHYGQVQHIQSLQSGSHWLSVRLRDRAGNEIRKRIPFYINQ
ncbi:M23 family metallopeptidase [bacterium]